MTKCASAVSVVFRIHNASNRSSMGDETNGVAGSHIHYGVIDATHVTGASDAQPLAAGDENVDFFPDENKEDALPESIQSHKRLIEAFEMQRTARHIAAPTLDDDVKLRLRELGEPICLFGEGVSQLNGYDFLMWCSFGV